MPIPIPMATASYLHAEGGRETDEVGADTEAGTSPSANGQTGDIGIQNAESGSSSKGDKRDLIEGKAAFRNSVGGDGHHNTFNQILNGSLDEFA